MRINVVLVPPHCRSGAFDGIHLEFLVHHLDHAVCPRVFSQCGVGNTAPCF